MNPPIQLTDELLLRALQQRTRHAPSATLLDRIHAATVTAPQLRPGLGWLRPARWTALPALGAAAAILVAVVLVFALVRPAIISPGASPTSSPPVPSPSPAIAPLATPQARLLGSADALRLRLGLNTAPVDVTFAFGSIWVADLHANDVRRFDPATMEELARIHVVGGPAWFAVADEALWVTTQLGKGLTRIDPATNLVVATVGDDPPCTAPVVAFESIFQSACDADVFIRIDPVTNRVISRFPANGHLSLVLAGGQLITSGRDGLSRLDPDSGALSPIGPSVSAGDLLAGSDGESVWYVNNGQVFRIDPTDGRTIATLDRPGAASITFSEGHAWLTAAAVGAVEIDLATNTAVRTIPLTAAQLLARDLAGYLWISDFDNNDLWRVAR